MIIFLIFAIIGLIVGSFLNVVILRGGRGETLYGRSHCESCGTKLSLKELIPIASFLIQKGRCLHCSTVLLQQYPLVELGTGLLYGFAAYYTLSTSVFTTNSLLLLIGILTGIAGIIVILVSDLRYQIIPDGAVFILFLLGIIQILYRTYPMIYRSELIIDVAISLILSIFLGSLWFLSKGTWMGLGDAKLVLATSLILGFPAAIYAFLFAFWIGGLMGIILLIFKIKTLKNRIPFGPFILIGSALAYYLTPQFISFI